MIRMEICCGVLGSRKTAPVCSKLSALLSITQTTFTFAELFGGQSEPEQSISRRVQRQCSLLNSPPVARMSSQRSSTIWFLKTSPLPKTQTADSWLQENLAIP